MVPGRSRWRAVLLWILLAVGPAAHVSLSAQEPPPKRPAQDEFVPLSELPPQEQLPAAPLLIAAYSVAWIVVAGYLFSIWRRMGRVEQELAEVSRRLQQRRS
jgi:CcmD family protein